MAIDKKKLSCSIIICTYNRAPYLEKLLIGLEHLNYRDFEVVIVNGPSTDWTEQLLADYKGRVKVANNSERNYSKSRNIGIAAASGDIVIFIDDDAIPADPFWLDRIMDIFESDTEETIGAGGGGSIHRHTRYFEFDGGYVNDYCDQVFHKNDLNEQEESRSRFVRRANGNNCACRRKVLEEIGGWDEHFIYYADEADACFRIADRGYKTVYIKDSNVRHFPAPAHYGAPLIRSRRLVTRSDTYFSLKNGKDALPLRILKTLWKAPRKHFFTEMFRFFGQKKLSFWDLVSFIFKWITGLVQGIGIGLFSKRRTRLAAYETQDEFVPFITGKRPSRKQRICLVSKGVPGINHTGGIARYMYDLAWGLHQLGHEVHMFAEDNQRIRFENLGFYIHGISHKERPEVPILYSSLANMLSYSMAVYYRLRDLAEQGITFDFIKSCTWDLVSLVSIYRKQYPNIVMIHTPHETIFKYDAHINQQERQLINSLEYWMLRNSDGVVFSSKSHIAHLNSEINLNTADTRTHRIIPLGIKPTPVAAVNVYSGSRKRLLFVGRFEYRKGIDLILDVVPEILSNNPDWECHLVGNNWTPTAMQLLYDFEMKYKHAEWRNRLMMPGVAPDDELFQYYAGCDIFMAPSRYESFGLIYLEAMQYGAACIGTNAGGVPSIIEHGKNGLLVEPGNADSLKNAVQELITKDEMRNSIGAEGEKTFRNSFMHTHLAENILSFGNEFTENTSSEPFVFVDPLKAMENIPVSSMLTAERQNETDELILECLGLVTEENPAQATQKIKTLLKNAEKTNFTSLDEIVALDKQQPLSAAMLDILLNRSLKQLNYSACGLLIKTLLNRDDLGPKVLVKYSAILLALPEEAVNKDLAALKESSYEIISEHPPEALNTVRFLIRSGNGTGLKTFCDTVLSRKDIFSDPNHICELHYHLGSLLKREGDLDAAKKHLDTIIEHARNATIHNSYIAGAHFHLGEIALNKNHEKKARSHFRKTLSLNPNHGKAAEYLRK